jgi:flagellar basal-body rod protein FlgB
MGDVAMTSKIDQAFGLSATALQLFGRRAEVIAANLANADTPGYKARDIDFKAVLQGVMNEDLTMRRTAEGHIDTGTGGLDPQLLYRVPMQPSADGNTVDAQLEQAQFAQNAVRHQASYTFLDATIKNLLSAIKGE